ncbi:hypothetical protein RvY_01403 [Ramazzottius varieornatus]|uniref:Secreted protein n=1 Tax=Ramazzottius varieornatus TaxID=947166 RepID=A0A1D1UGJ6_RAMVA|nr:hypothetical protein RvY_01403 [Ramazzottius varieornatus]
MDRQFTGILLICLIAFCYCPMTDALYSIPFLTLRRPNTVRSPWTWSPARTGSAPVSRKNETTSAAIRSDGDADWRSTSSTTRICGVLFERLNYQGEEQVVYNTSSNDRKSFSPFQSAIVRPGCRLSTCMRRPSNGHCFFFSETRSHSSVKMYPSYLLKCVCS